MSTPRADLVHVLAHDQMVANAARVTRTKWREWRLFGASDERLIRYMLKNKHGTPFEHTYFQFRISAPIFAQRDWMRHRVGHSFNEISTRWQDMSEMGVYEPECLRVQVGRAHEYLYEDFDPLVAANDEKIKHWWRRRALVRTQERAVRRYKRMVRKGYAKEQAMAVLPMGTYTEFVWSCNARSLMHFLGLRSQPNARKEIRIICDQVEAFFSDAMPVTHAAWVASGRVAP